MTKYTLESSREWYNNLPGKLASAAMIIRWNDSYLMIKDDYKEAMTFPSGIVDPSESAKHAAIRETQEEVGFDLPAAAVEFYSVAYISETYGFNDRFHFYFIVEIDDVISDTMKLAPGIEYHKWVSSSEISELAGKRPAYTRLQEILESSEPVPYFEV